MLESEWLGLEPRDHRTVHNSHLGNQELEAEDGRGATRPSNRHKHTQDTVP